MKTEKEEARFADLFKGDVGADRAVKPEHTAEQRDYSERIEADKQGALSKLSDYERNILNLKQRKTYGTKIYLTPENVPQDMIDYDLFEIWWKVKGYHLSDSKEDALQGFYAAIIMMEEAMFEPQRG